MDAIRERLEKQGSEIASLRTYISDIVNLKSIKTNESLQRSMKWMTWVMLILTVIATSLSIITYGSPAVNWMQKAFSESTLLNMPLAGVTILELLTFGLILTFFGILFFFIIRRYKQKSSSELGEKENSNPQTSHEDRPPFRISRVFELYFAVILGALAATLWEIYLGIENTGEKTSAGLILVGVVLFYAIGITLALWAMDWVQWVWRRHRS